jgi:hypothetical protein
VWEGNRAWQICRGDVGETIFEMELLKSRHELEEVEELLACG